MPIEIAVPRETRPGERRVALSPELAGRLCEAGHVVRVETGAGAAAGWTDDDYVDAGARTCPDAAGCITGADVVLKVNAPRALDADAGHEADLLARGQHLACMLDPLGDEEGVRRLAERGVTSWAMELIPRISRAQSMDALSSMATVTGYRAVLQAAERSDRFFPMLMTAAGTVAPAKVFVIGAGVAGLQAIATARRLGAVVTAYDTRAAVAEQVESLGARFMAFDVTGEDAEAAGGYARELTAEEQERQRELMADHVAACDVVVTTALVPGRPAPVLIPLATVERMRPGAVIVDLASQNGGNCEASVHGEEVVHAGVRVLGPENLPAGMPVHASTLYGRNVVNLLELLLDDDGALAPDLEDEVVAGTLATRDGDVVHPMLRERYHLDTGAER